MVMNYKPDQPLTEADFAIIGKKSARIDIPLMSRGGVLEAIGVLFDLQRDLIGAAKNADIPERSSLLESRLLIEQANQKMKMLRSREEITLQDRRDAAEKVVQMGNTR